MKKIILLSLSILLISLAYSFAEVPCKINYQGRLIKDNVPVDGTKTMVFSIYDSAVGPTLLWTSGNVSVEVHNGLFRYVIGSGGTDLSGIDWTAGQALYLEVQVGTDILTPREELSAYPYAINSHLLEGKTKEYFLDTSGDTQTKQGNLNIMGNLGIGTTSPGTKLDVNGAISGFGIVPIGSIVAWHKSFTNTPSLPDGWVECNGQTLSDLDSPYDGQVIPDLNGDGRFLRGSSTSGTEQQDAFQGHKHGIPVAYGGAWGGPKKVEYTYATDNYSFDPIMDPTPVTDGVNGTPRTASETRPINMSVVWIIRVK